MGWQFLPLQLARSAKSSGWCQAPTATLRESGDVQGLAAEEAIRAYKHYLALRVAPEPALQPQVEAVRRELIKLEKASVGK